MTTQIGGTTGITFPDASTQNTAATGFGFKNRIINGAMMIDQRNAGAGVTVNSQSVTYTVDRFYAVGQATDGVFTVRQYPITTLPGFSHQTEVYVTTADSSIGASQFYGFYQAIEGFNTADLYFGSANASPVTLSFWVRSSITGTFGGSLRNSASDRSYVFSYSISNANTWEYKTITIPGDTTGTWLKDHNTGIRISWSLGDGSSRLTTAGSWQAGSFTGVTGQTQLISNLNATWDITGVQLEKGSTATSFDYRPYGTELALCQRYFQVNGATSGNLCVAVGQAVSGSQASASYVLPVVMRTSPTLTIPAGATWVFLNANGSSGVGGTIATTNSAQFGIVSFNLTGASGLVAGNATQLLVSYHGFKLSAEL